MNQNRMHHLIFIVLVTRFFAISAFSARDHDFLAFEKKLVTQTKDIERALLENQVLGDNRKTDSITRALPKKPWTFLVYMAADNELRAFAANNIKQMAAIGSNEHINIVIHLDIRLNENQKITRWYYIEKNRLNHLNYDQVTQHMDSGDPQTLISFCKWAIGNYPAQNYALILWNHGTGILDPKYYKMINPAELFTFNPTTNRLELDRSIAYLTLFDQVDLDQRGICWDTSSGTYLSNQKLEHALNEICTKSIGGKFKLIGFDACLMSMVEVGSLLKPYADIMVGSQEVELGPGWDYMHVLEPFLEKSIDTKTLADHIVTAYRQSYKNITHDFTQSAIDLQKIEMLEKNIDAVAKLLLECLKKQQNDTVRAAIQESRNRKLCTHFDEPSYIDLHHFYTNLQANIGKFNFISPTNLAQQLTDALTEGKKIIEQIVFSNISGKNLKHARGISIYFPDRYIHPSYSKSQFAQDNAWATLIQQVRK